MQNINYIIVRRKPISDSLFEKDLDLIIGHKLRRY